jgi:hypothetical protein
LRETRRTLIAVMPSPFRERAIARPGRRRPVSSEEWQRALIELALQMAEGEARGFYSERRAACPLCREPGVSLHGGFRLPDGMRRHLEGSGRSRRCAVMHAAFELAREASADPSRTFVGDSSAAWNVPPK